MPINPNIPLQAANIPQIRYQPESQFESFAKIQPTLNAMQQMRTQTIEAQEKMARIQGLQKAQQDLIAAGKSGDMGMYADALLTSPDAALRQLGAQIKKTILEAQAEQQALAPFQGGPMSHEKARNMMLAGGVAGQVGVNIARTLPPELQVVGGSLYKTGPGEFVEPPPRPAPAPVAPVAGGATGVTQDQASRMLAQRGFRLRADGTAEPIPGGPADPEVIRRQQEARRLSPTGAEGTPAQQQRAQAQSVAQQQLSQELQTVIGYYDQLNKIGAMTSPGRSTVENVIASARASGLGQAAERAVATQAQTLRDNIANARLRIFNHVKNATGASASQMNSNVEFTTWLNALTSPGQSIETVRETLKQLDAVLGSVRSQVQREEQGGTVAPAPASRQGAAAPAPARTSGTRREIAPGVFVTERP